MCPNRAVGGERDTIALPAGALKLSSPRSSGFDLALRPETAAAPKIRPLHPSDRSQLEQILRASGNFTEEEVTIALEVIDDALAGKPDYTINVLESAPQQVAGYECHGAAPLTAGTFDLYWIAVDPRVQARGFGQMLLRTAEEDVIRRGGRLLLIETSSQASYDKTARFYKRSGYRLEARIHDFYRPGDDKLVFAKNLGS